MLSALARLSMTADVRSEMKKKLIIIGIVALVVLYVAGPIIAGATRSDNREGPVIYPEEFHTSLYIIAHESAFQEKPRQRRDYWMYRRPFFYGMSRRLKSAKERQAYIDMARENGSRRIDDLIKMNERAIGIGTPLAERPPHTTNRTDRVISGSAYAKGLRRDTSAVY